MKKCIVRIVVGVAVLLLVGLGLTFFFLNSIVKKGVETIGPKVTKVDMRLGGAKISPFSGSGQLTDFFMGNPEGFKTPSAVTVGDMKLAIKLSSLLSDVIQVDQIHIQAPEITFEGGLSGSNLGKILDNINEAAGSSEPKAGDKAEKKSAKNVYIRDVAVEGGKINVSVTIAGGKSITVPLPPLHLQNIGSPEQGVTTAEAARQIMKVILTEATKAAANAGGNITKGVKDLGEGAKEQADKTVDKLKGLFK